MNFNETPRLHRADDAPVPTSEGSTNEGTSAKAEKKTLKEFDYNELSPFYDKLPEELPIPSSVVEVINDKAKTEEEMLEGHEVFTTEEAFGLACKFLKEKNQEGIIWFKGGATIKHDTQTINSTASLNGLNIDKKGGVVAASNLGYKWPAGTKFFFKS